MRPFFFLRSLLGHAADACKRRCSSIALPADLTLATPNCTSPAAPAAVAMGLAPTVAALSASRSPANPHNCDWYGFHRWAHGSNRDPVPCQHMHAGPLQRSPICHPPEFTSFLRIRQTVHLDEWHWYLTGQCTGNCCGVVDARSHHPLKQSCYNSLYMDICVSAVEQGTWNLLAHSRMPSRSISP